jgi:DNA-binding NarL/FixJ family response regulator
LPKAGPRRRNSPGAESKSCASSAIESRRTLLFQKLKLRSAVELVRHAVREGLIEI